MNICPKCGAPMNIKHHICTLCNFAENNNISQEIFTKVVGSNFNNEDGTSRQYYLSKCKEKEPLMLSHSPITQDHNAIIVYRLDHTQIGYLRRGIAAEIAPLLD